MRYLFVICIALFSINMHAQRPNHRHKSLKHQKHLIKAFSAEQLATLKTKRMTLLLDLSEAQQRDVYNINLTQSKKQKARLKLRQEQQANNKPATSQELFEKMSQSLDEKILYKNQLKTLLSKEQFKKWSELKKRKKRRNSIRR